MSNLAQEPDQGKPYLDLSAPDSEPFANFQTQPPKPGHRLTSDPDIFDGDNLAIPELWRANPSKWQSLPISTRMKLSKAHMELLPMKTPTKPKTYAPPFSTRKTREWGKRQRGTLVLHTPELPMAVGDWQTGGRWTVLASESYNPWAKKSNDTFLGSDIVFDCPIGLVAVQGAGKGERAPHYQRFLDRGGVEKANRLHIMFLYLEFLRKGDDPILLERWA